MEDFKLEAEHINDVMKRPDKPRKAEQAWLFLPHIDVRPGNKREPSLMDYLADMGAI